MLMKDLGWRAASKIRRVVDAHDGVRGGVQHEQCPAQVGQALGLRLCGDVVGEVPPDQERASPDVHGHPVVVRG